MIYRRGDVLLAVQPFATGTGQRRRPVLVIQDDAYNVRLANTVVAQITTNRRHAGDAAHLLIDPSTSEGMPSGLLHPSVVSCLNFVTLTEDRIDRKIGSLSPGLMANIDDGLRAALGL